MAGIQFMGLSSGLDTESIVTALLSGQQSKIDQATNEKTKLEWTQECWKDVNSKLNSFYSKYVDKLRMQSTFESYKATSSSSAVSVKNSGALPVGTHRIKVDKLATEISLHGDITDDRINSKDASFKSMGVLAEGEEAKLQITVDEKYTDAAGIEQVRRVNKEITVTADMNLTQLENQVKKYDETLNINFDIDNKKLFISSKESGTNAKLEMAVLDDATGLFDKLGLTELKRPVEAGETGDVTDPNDPNIKYTKVSNADGSINITGTGAEYTYNGVKLTASSNEIEVNGLKVTLHDETTDEVVISVESDPDKIVDFIEEFVNEYNTVLEDLYKKYNATKVSEDILTDEEKEKMTDSEIEKYEQTIKDSLLRRDSNLRNVIDAFRNSMQTYLPDNAYKSLSAIGITTGSYTENGKLTLDKDKLKAALEENPEAVKNLFTATGTDSSGKTDSSKMGAATKLNTAMQSLYKRIDNAKSYQSYYYDIIHKEKIESAADKIEELKDRYKRMEEIYYAKFTAMEKALSTLNSQSSSLTSMLG